MTDAKADCKCHIYPCNCVSDNDLKETYCILHYLTYYQCKMDQLSLNLDEIWIETLLKESELGYIDKKDAFWKCVKFIYNLNRHGKDCTLECQNANYIKTTILEERCLGINMRNYVYESFACRCKTRGISM